MTSRPPIPCSWHHRGELPPIFMGCRSDRARDVDEATLADPAGSRRSKGEITMVRMIRFPAAVLTAFTLYALAPASIGATPAEAAVVYCKAVGVPKGCVVRPTTVVVYCTAPGVPYGCVVRPGLRRSGRPWSSPRSSSRRASAFTAGRSIAAARSIASAGADHPCHPAVSSTFREAAGQVEANPGSARPDVTSRRAPQRSARLCMLARPRDAFGAPAPAGHGRRPQSRARRPRRLCAPAGFRPLRRRSRC